MYSSGIVQGVVEPELMNNSLSFFIVSLVNAIFCFFIVKHNPLSILFVPLVINAFILMMAFFNAAFWLDPWWVPVVTGYVVCMMASIIGVLMRKKSTISHIQVERRIVHRNLHLQ